MITVEGRGKRGELPQRPGVRKQKISYSFSRVFFSFRVLFLFTSCIYSKLSTDSQGTQMHERRTNLTFLSYSHPSHRMGRHRLTGAIFKIKEQQAERERTEDSGHTHKENLFFFFSFQPSYAHSYIHTYIHIWT